MTDRSIVDRFTDAAFGNKRYRDEYRKQHGPRHGLFDEDVRQDLNSIARFYFGFVRGLFKAFVWVTVFVIVVNGLQDPGVGRFFNILFHGSWSDLFWAIERWL